MPLDYHEFQARVRAAIQKFQGNWLNPEQNQAVSAPPSPPVFIVAGPGTGKTTVLALRVLKHIFVDGFPPESIMATTFTRKAASELRSRILSWGVTTQQEAVQQAQGNGEQQKTEWLLSLDINQVKTGTLDSLAEEMLANDRQPGEITPTVIDGFMAKGLLRNKVMLRDERYNSKTLENHLCKFNKQFPGVRAFSDKLKACHSFADRFLHDGVSISYADQSDGHQTLVDIVKSYHNCLIERQLLDFALLEQEILNRLQRGRLQSTKQSLRALLVDEFQDTNYLQEQIYYSLCRGASVALTVVGDDDQSIYRFRGATVEIFANFSDRIQTALGKQWNPTQINLVNNYRSSERIVNFINHFIGKDSSFQAARVPNKKACVASSDWAKKPDYNVPILGIFRRNAQELSDEICHLLNDVFKGDGRTINVSNHQFTIQRNSNGGDFGDAVLLAGKVQETKYDGKPRLPLLIRQHLNNSLNVDVFNPRGRNFAKIPEVMQCLGTMLECIDPNGKIQDSIKSIRSKTKEILNDWRDASKKFVQLNPSPSLPNTNSLQNFINNWANRNAPNMNNWPSEWPLLELLFTVVSWFPLFQTSPEGQIYLETIARTITEASQISPYRSMIKNEGTIHDKKSVEKAIREVFEAIAEGEVEVDEEIMPYVPRSVFPVMTIHQAKGLEFPLVIVDVGSDFSTNHEAQKHLRFPDKIPDVHRREYEIADFSPVGRARSQRKAIDRAFDDIRRQFFVAKSRSQCVLILAGLTTQLTWKPKQNSYQVPSVATGDLRNGGRVYQFIPAQQWTPDCPANTIALI
jgi:DNA helicase-2/ATP-dependent DNA helicase PcrA